MKPYYFLPSFILTILFTFLISSNNIFSQNKEYVGIKTLVKDGQVSMQTIPEKNSGEIESLNEHLYGKKSTGGEQFVLGGTELWSTQDPVAIANVVSLNDAGNSVLTGWGLNDMRVTLYSDINNIPFWNYSTTPYDPFVDISSDGSKIAAAAGTNFYLLNPSNGNVDYQFTLPDSFYASSVSLARDGSMAVVLANAIGNSTTYRAYAFDLAGGTPSVRWTFDVPASEVTNWAGVNFSADGTQVAITGRFHLYVFSSADGILIWDHFLDNTESPPAISGDGKVVVTADNSGFVQTWHFNFVSNEYDLLWKYRIPPGLYTNWASSVGISANGNTIVAGSLIWATASTYEGSVICFDTYSDGRPKWVFSGAGDLVDNISVSDDGRVAAAVTWGDLAQTRPDLMVFDVETGYLTFSVTTLGSFFTCDLSPDGKRVFAGGKAVHAREFGNGGRIYLCDIDLGGGNVSGNVDLTNTTDDSGVLVKAEGTVRSAVTDINGNYIIKNIPAGTYTIKAKKPGYNFGSASNIVVTEGNTTSGVNFSLNQFPTQPPTLNASSGLVGAILLNWSTLISNPEREKEVALMVGDEYLDNTSQALIHSVKENNSVTDNTNLFQPWFLADSIAVYRSPVAGGPYQKIASVPATQNSYADSNVFALRHYYYVVNIYNESGQSIYSNEAVGQVSDTLLTFSVDVPEASIPTIDGVLSSGEWDDAVKLDISDIFGYGGGIPKPQGSVYMYLKFNDTNNMLYVAGEDFLNTTLDDNEGFGLYFDDNNNNTFESRTALPVFQEGNFWAYWHPGGSDLRFRQIFTGGGVGTVQTLTDGEVEFSSSSGHLQGEVAIPMGFQEGYQLQVYGPDKVVGLGAFLIARQGSTPLFNGWWPQTMNYVFNPMYYGDVGIDVSLDAPPQIPSNISVTRQGEDLLLTWQDPSLGLNNEPLPVPPTINIYKNGELLTTFQAGVQSYLDNEVYCVAWYEYQFEAFIIIGGDTLTGPMSNPFGEFACQEPTLVPISYDDGEWDGFYYVGANWDNNKFAVRFTPTTYPTYLRRLQTTVNGKDDFDLTVQRDNSGVPGDTVAGPYRVFDTGSSQVGTITKNLPGLDPFEITDGDFWIVINWLQETPYSPYICGDSDPPIDNRSMYYQTSSGWTTYTFADFMVTAYVSDQPVGFGGEYAAEPPFTFDMKQNYPNPFNPSTVITYQIPKDENVALEIYNALGQKVRTLVNETQEAGHYQITWDGKNNSGNQLSSGIYLYRITAGNFVKVMKMVLLR